MTWVVIAVAASFSLLLLSLRYWLLPEIEQYRESIASAISHASGQYVTIGKISANWDGFRPHMMMRAIRVHDKDGDIMLLLHRLEGTLSWRSIVHGKLHFREIEIDQPDLIVRRDAEGMIHVAGFALNKEWTGNENGLSDWLLNQRRVLINNASILWQDDQRGAPELDLLVNLRLENRGSHHRFGLNAVAPAELATRLDIRGDFTSVSFDNPALWQGRLFTQIDHADVAALSLWLPFPPEIKLSRGGGALRMWAGIDGEDIKKITVDMRLRDVKTRLASDLPELSVAHLRGRVGWRQIRHGSTEGIEIFSKGLSASLRNKQELRPLNFSLQLIPSQRGKPGSGKLSLDTLNLESVVGLAKYFPLDAPLRERLHKLSPRGQVHHIRAKWRDEWSTPTTFSAKGGFTNLGMKESGALPAFRGITGNADIGEHGGTLSLNSQNAILDFSHVFKEPLKLETLTGQASWNRLADNDSLVFKFSNISFSNDHAAGSAYGSYRSTSHGPGVLDLAGHVTRADARYLVHHLPQGTNSRSRDWLENSIAGGEFSDIRLHLKGDLSNFPFVRRNGIFRLHAKASEVTLDNIPQWPRIENISGHLQFHRGRMEFDTSHATIQGANLSRGKVYIADITAADALMKGEVEASGATGEFMRLAAQNMAPNRYEGLVNDISVTGNGQLQLQLDIPLHHPGAMKLSGSYQFIDNEVHLGPKIPGADSINGTVTFTEAGIRMENVTARLLGGPASINSVDMPDGSTRLSAHGRINLDNSDLSWQRGDPPAAQSWTRRLRGSADWRAAINVKETLVDVSIESSLRGITSDLPEPFSKASTDSALLRFERKAVGPDRDELTFRYGNVVTAKLARIQDEAGKYQTEHGIVTFGGTPLSLTGKPGISVQGRLSSLNLDRWRGLLMQLNDGSTFSSNLTNINLDIGAVEFLGRRFDNLTLNARKEDRGWHSSIASNEVSGDVHWDPSADGKLVARLNRLVIPGRSSPKSSPETLPQQQEKNLPILDVTADIFLVGGKNLGKLELTAKPQEQNWRIQKLHITSPDSSITARGLWQSRAAPPRVQVALTLEASNIGKFLTRLGHPERVKRGSGKIEGVLSWHGSPLSIDYATLSGSFKINAKRGQFPKFEPGIGRLFGIFDLRALPRRITLDFHDVFSEGFGFDDISGDVRIAQGVASTDDLKVDGPAAKVVMNGELNLEAETQELHIKVTPSYGLAAPVVGMASVIASTAFQNPVTSSEYNVTGTWTDPVVTKLSRWPRESGQDER
ncbi:MAG: TIGR02099 family protein [Nitrosospira sp.]|nr:TIGR02099 family protein [Nitrosospira sp.]